MNGARTGQTPTGRPNAGFTLVEIALAMLVFALGILSFFAVLSAALNQANHANDQTQCAIFADGAMAGLRTISDELAETATSNEWAVFWEALRDGTTNVPVAMGGSDSVWLGNMVVRGDGDVHVNTYTNYPLHGGATNVVDHIVHYRLAVAVTNALASIPWSSRATVTLKVWEGEFSQARDTDAVLFYTEYSDRGGVR